MITDLGIDRGQFVVEYVGEIISTVEAKKRQQEYDQLGLNFLMVVREFS
jgi:SET domain-containing protein